MMSGKYPTFKLKFQVLPNKHYEIRSVVKILEMEPRFEQLKGTLYSILSLSTTFLSILSTL